MRRCWLITLIFCVSCGVGPGSLAKLEKAGIPYPKRHATLILPASKNKSFSFQYLGCGGLHFIKDGESLLIDPFFSNQSLSRIGRSLWIGKTGLRIIASNAKMVNEGWKAIQNASGKTEPDVKAILSAHSHFDHLLDIPALTQKIKNKPKVFLNQSGYYNCQGAIDTARMVILENHMTTLEKVRDPVELRSVDGRRILVYPILSEHNPHFKNIKFFDGELTRPMNNFNSPYEKTRANDWLEGHTFSFLVDYLTPAGEIDLRLFIQSSSCNPPYGIPPEVLRTKPVDVAFLGIASHQFSPDYPCTLLEGIKPREIVWIHWEDFFRKYTKSPKTVRGTDVPGLFDKLCLRSYRSTAHLLWPGVKVEVEY